MENELTVGTRVRFHGGNYRLADGRIGMADGAPGEYARDVDVPQGTTGTVVQSDGRGVRVVLDAHWRACLPIDEVAWPAGGQHAGMPTHDSIAFECVEIAGRPECPECGNADGRLFDADCHHSEWVVFCVNLPTSEGGTCGMTAFSADLSEDARRAAAVAIERDAPILARIRGIIDALVGDSLVDPAAADGAALEVLALVNEHRATEEV